MTFFFYIYVISLWFVGTTETSAVYVIFINPHALVLSHQKISSTSGDFTWALPTSSNFGSSCDGLGDVNADGIPDAVVGSAGDDSATTSASGAVYILFLLANGKVLSSLKLATDLGGFTMSLSADDSFGLSSAKLDDLDNNGLADILVGSPGDDTGSTGAGSVFILFLSHQEVSKDEWESGFSSAQKISYGSGDFTAELDKDGYFGHGCAGMFDLNHDGNPEIAVSVLIDDDAGDNTGAVYIIFLLPTGLVLSFQKISYGSGGFTAVGSESFGIGLGNNLTHPYNNLYNNPNNNPDNPDNPDNLNREWRFGWRRAGRPHCRKIQY